MIAIKWEEEEEVEEGVEEEGGEGVEEEGGEDKVHIMCVLDIFLPFIFKIDLF